MVKNDANGLSCDLEFKTKVRIAFPPHQSFRPDCLSCFPLFRVSSLELVSSLDSGRVLQVLTD